MKPEKSNRKQNLKEDLCNRIYDKGFLFLNRFNM
jgi:hypothetical protein